MIKEKMLIKDLMQESNVKFGTSGARGLVSNMTDKVCYTYTVAFINYLEQEGLIKRSDSVAVAGDLRPSTPRIMRAVLKAIADKGYIPLNCGFIPSPAVAYYGIRHSIASIMVTGSHIPDDRNGIKFNKPQGEILKEDEIKISSQSVELDAGLFNAEGMLKDHFSIPSIYKAAEIEYKKRYLDFFENQPLSGLRIGVYQHSAVGRDILLDIVCSLGATVIPLGYSNSFVAVDTEAIRPEDVELAKRWVQEYKLDAIFSTDGDSDRPLLADEKGGWIRGDVGGILCAYFLNADFISLPVSCNTAVEMTGWFKKVKRTKIGSPYVISQMQELAQENVQGIVVGYEANGGFLLETEVKHGLNILSPLPTRDALIYLLGITLLSKEQNKTLSQLVEELPKRYTYSGRLQNFPQTESTKILNYFSETLSKDDLKERINSCFAQLTGNVFQVDNTDGVRMIFESGDVIHLRPSGNAPEFRCYTESDSLTRAVQLNSSIFDWIRSFNFKQV